MAPKLRGSVPFNKTFGYIMSKISSSEPEEVTRGMASLVKYVDNNTFNAGDRVIYFGASGLAGVWASRLQESQFLLLLEKKPLQHQP